MSIMRYDGAMTQEAIPAASAKPGPGGLAEPADLRSSTGYLLARLGAESRRRWARMLADHGLTPHHFGILMTLDHLGTAHQRRLSELVGVDPRNAVPLLDLLRQAADAIEADMLKGLDQHQQASLHRLLRTLYESTIGQ